MPRHSMYFLPLPLDFNDEETDSLSQLFPTENNECSVESSQNYLSDKTTPLNPCHITSNSILSHCSLTGKSYVTLLDGITYLSLSDFLTQ